MILAIDQGTTGTTCLVFDERGRPAGRAYREFQQYFPRPGPVERGRRVWEDQREELLAGWRRALERSRGWAKDG